MLCMKQHDSRRPRAMTGRIWQHPWLRIERLIRSILEVRRDPMTRPVMKATLVEALKERDRIRRAGWMN